MLANLHEKRRRRSNELEVLDLEDARRTIETLLKQGLATATAEEWASLIYGVCRRFACAYEVRPPRIHNGVHTGGPVTRAGHWAWLDDRTLFTCPESWAWTIASLTPDFGPREKGAVSTAPALARYMCSLALDAWCAGEDRDQARFRESGSLPTIVDPAVGGGAFVLAMASEMANRSGDDGRAFRQAAVRRMTGVDVDPVCVTSARAASWLYSLAGAGVGEPAVAPVYHGDSLLEPPGWWSSGPGEQGSFDILVANPPYVRQELIGDERKAALTRAYPGFSGRCDIYVYFFALAAALLKEGGVAAIVCPVSWLDVAYGKCVKEFMLDRFEIEDIIASDDARWFHGASVNAQVVVLRKNAAGARLGVARFARAGGGLGGEPLSIVSSRAVAQRLLDPAEKWGTYLRAPEPYFALMEATGGRLCRLGDLATVSFGTKTGANEFFYLRDVSETAAGTRFIGELDGRASRSGLRAVQPVSGFDRNRVFALESSCLTPAVKSLREVKGYRVRPEGLRIRAFATPPDEADLPPFAREYIRRGEMAGYSSRPTCRSRNPWYRLSSPPAGILYAMSWGSRMGAVLCPRGTIFDARLYGIEARVGVDVLALAAAVNATLTWLFTEVSGRPMTGSLPLLDIKIYEVEQLPVLDLRRLDSDGLDSLRAAMNRLLGRPLLDIREEVLQQDRRELDELVLTLAGYPPARAQALAAEVADAVATMVAMRISKSERVLE
ncbi:MAG: SAM-dependent DNA methyltransferase [Firmicutes bacterium]|nr:SAM-dependent DNA methyltransferase [Bacillota bacterium]